MPTAPLLVTKLAIPPLREGLVARPRLTRLLDAGLAAGRKLTLVSAGAGFGKTTLVAEWARRRASGAEPAGAVSWLSLDEGDGDPARFLAYLLAALQQAEPGLGRAAQARLGGTPPPAPEALLGSLINDLAAAPRPISLILDDYHLIQALGVHEQLGYLIDHLPAQLHIVLATREDPPLPLARLRARNQVVELRQAELQFTLPEAAEFLRQAAAIALTPADVDWLHRRTEGWIAGLQLAALSLHSPDDLQRLLGSLGETPRFILDYLIDEVYRKQPEPVQAFLLLTSILDRFNAALCQALTGQADAASVLRALDRANLFLVPLDEAREWYRYHRLFGDLLRHRLQLEQPEQIPAFHQRASEWYAAHGFGVEAVRHALAACDWNRAADLLLGGTAASLMRQGQVATLLEWLGCFPPEYVLGHPDLAADFSWPLILSGQLDQAQDYLEVAEQAAAGPPAQPAQLGYLAAARAHLARARGQHQAAVELSERALALLPPDSPLDRSALSLNVGLACWYQGRLAEAETRLAEARAQAARSGNGYIAAIAAVFLNRALMARGKLRAAAAAHAQLAQSGAPAAALNLAFCDLARLHREWNDLAAAEAHARRSGELAQQSGGDELEAAARVLLALVRQARGDPASAQAELLAARDLLQQPGMTPAGPLHYLMGRISAALAAGDLAEAARGVEQIPAPEAAGSFPEYAALLLARARYWLASGRPAAAAEQARAVMALAGPAGWASLDLQARAVLAASLPNPEEALDVLGPALAQAEPEGYVRAFIDLGPPMAALLRQARARGLSAAYAGRLLAALEPEADRPQTAEPPELFSGRELDVLRLLAAGQTNQEIAQALFISVNTVKTHLEHIYAKLTVSGRRQAVRRARQLGLLP